MRQFENLKMFRSNFKISASSLPNFQIFKFSNPQFSNHQIFKFSNLNNATIQCFLNDGSPG
jgi:hypothetical protein